MAHARHPRSAPRIATALAGVVALTLVLGALTAPVAGAATSTKFYTGTVTPTRRSRVARQRTRLRSPTRPRARVVGSANINVPADFTSVTIGAVTPPPGKIWTATLVSGVIMLRNPGPGL